MHIASKLVSGLVIAALIYSSTAWSQCAPGVPSAGNPGCIPPDQPTSPYYQGGAAAPKQPPAVWADRWGAIVIDGRTGQAGLVAHKASEQEAIEVATRDCSKFGSPNCKLQLTYHNQCVAVAWGSTQFETAAAPTIKQAEANAMDGCNSITTACKVAYKECSFAERVQ